MMKIRSVILVLVLLTMVGPVAAQDPGTRNADGIYVTPDESLIPTETGYKVFAPYACEQLATLLGASEWTLIDQMAYSLDPTSPYSIVWGAFKRGDQGLFFRGMSSTVCQGELTFIEPQAISISGDENFEGAVNAYPLMCMASFNAYYDYETDEEMPGVTLLLAYDLPDDTTIMLSLELPHVEGTYALWNEDDEPSIFSLHGSALFPHGMFTNGVPDAGITMTPYMGGYDDPMGTAEITSTEPYVARITLDAMEGNIELTTDVVCPTVFGSEFQLDS